MVVGISEYIIHIFVEVDTLNDGSKHGLDGEGRRELLILCLRGDKDRLPCCLNLQTNAMFEVLGQVKEGLELAKGKGDGDAASWQSGRRPRLVGVKIGSSY